MALCTFSNELLVNSFTSVDNAFIANFLPKAPASAIKVYIYGLFLCKRSDNCDNNLNSFATELNMDVDDVMEAFLYWRELGLVQLISKNPLEVAYLPTLLAKAEPRKFKVGKFTAFNKELQEMFQQRMITPTEFNHYYDIIETTQMDVAAMLLIVKYCISIKGESVKYPYVLTVASDWAKGGVLTVKDVSNKIDELDHIGESLKNILNTLGKKSTPQFEDKEYYLKWTKSWGFEDGGILITAKSFKNKGNMAKLDKVLDEFYKMGIFTSEDIVLYISQRDKLFEIAKIITKSLGLYYESLDYIVENYIGKWLQQGFSEDALKRIAEFCFKTSVRTFEGMNIAVQKFYTLGLLNLLAINEHIANLASVDRAIQEIIVLSGSLRNITQADRDYFNVWTNVWGHNLEVVEFVAKLVASKSHSFRQVNQFLAKLKEKNVFEINAVKAFNFNVISDDSGFAAKPTPGYGKDYIKHEYTKQELDSFFYDITKLNED